MKSVFKINSASKCVVRTLCLGPVPSWLSLCFRPPQRLPGAGSSAVLLLLGLGSTGDKGLVQSELRRGCATGKQNLDRLLEKLGTLELLGG